ncbi:tellurite resistance TerB family protein [Ferrimonas aestuarii]|uniref:Tellurite resistance TerB family protein n=1 Tax=Ferrimonas aestuarii TaxID=2569539 RepID=A0A4U1BSY9_9GAMM|nr:tellurite resistance TerB family protein [Ferrimonas aestuarii]TKB58282.1 tellurite resistance TerB family protein [Ferrimonas aestuarii]
MDFKGLLNQVLASGGDLAKQAQQGLGQGSSSYGATKNTSQTGGMSDMTKGAIGGAVGGSLLTMLIGSKKGKKVGKKVAKFGGAAALGALALKVFNDYQAKQGQPVQEATAPAAAPVQSEPQLLPRSTSLDANQHSMVVLKAMIAAAKADGHVDNDERQRIHQAMQAIGGSAELTQFVENELNQPLDPADIAKGVQSQEEAAEVYLASVLMVDEQNFMEKSYLEELARQLNIAPDLAMQLQAQVVA